jgi:hypothetical protein
MRLMIIIWIWSLYIPAAWGQDFEKKAAELARLRAAVEQLEGQIQNERSSSSAELKSLIAQKGELSLLVQKEKIRVTALQKEHSRQLVHLEAENAKSSKMAPVLIESTKVVEKMVRSSLPFKQNERLADLSRIRQAVLRRTLSPQTAASQLWQFIEDELKLCQESGLYQQAIPLEDKTILADVARLGMVALLFRTNDGRCGFAEQQKDGSYRFRTVKPGPVQEGIREVFDALKKQIRSGFFRVPLPPITGGAS